MFYVVQICTVLAVTWASIYYEWGTTGYAVGVVAILAAAVVTLVIVEIRLLPSRFARLHDRIFGLHDEPADEVLRLPRTFRHPRDAFEDRCRLRIGKDPS
jgi:hypothetical protein